MNNYIKLNNDQKSSDQNVRKKKKKNLKYVFKNFLRKKPEIQVHLIRK